MLTTEQPADTLPHPGSTRAPLPRRLVGAALGVPEIGVLLPLIALTILFDVLNPSLLSPDSVSAMLRAIAFVGLIAIGEAALMICGELDLGVGSVAGLCGIATGWLMAHGWPIAPALLAGVIVGAVAGLTNGLLAVVVGVPAFIATLGMLYIARGANYLICHGIPLSIPPSLKHFGEAEPLGASWAFLIFIFAGVLAELGLRFTTFGRKIYATGGNVEVARIAGINTGLVKISVYVLTGALSGLAGILTMCQYNVAQPETGRGWELQVIAGVVIGGVSLFGGMGSVIGAFLGLLIMQIVGSGLTMTGVDTNWQTVAVGVIMIAAVSFDVLRRRTKR